MAEHGKGTFYWHLGCTRAGIPFLNETWMTENKYQDLFPEKTTFVIHAKKKSKGRPFGDLQIIINKTLKPEQEIDVTYVFEELCLSHFHDIVRRWPSRENILAYGKNFLTEHKSKLIIKFIEWRNKRKEWKIESQHHEGKLSQSSCHQKKSKRCNIEHPCVLFLQKIMNCVTTKHLSRPIWERSPLEQDEKWKKV